MLRRPHLSHYLVRMLGSFRSILCSVALVVSFSLGCAACSYHLGRPPVEAGFRVGEVVAPVVQPEIADVLASALSSALRRMDAAGERTLNARITRADWVATAATGGSVAAWEATLEVRYTAAVGGRALDSRRSTIVAGGSADPEALDVLRSDTFRALASASADEAITWFAYAPEAP